MHSEDAFEQAVIKLVGEALSKYQEQLTASGLQVQILPLRRTITQRGKSTEVEIHFLTLGQICDVLEFHIYRNGEQVVTIDELQIWLEQQLKQLVSSAPCGTDEESA